MMFSFRSMLALMLTVSTTLQVVVGAGDHEHESCACAAKEEGFAIDCSNQGAMNAALAALSANDCETDCEKEVCHRNFLIIQAHHDYCFESELPPSLEDALHIYEENCDGCEIFKKFDPSLPFCPQESCTDDSGNTAWTALISNSCGSDCSNTICGSNYRTLKVVHDNCPDGSLGQAAETNFHDMEETCDEQHGCNINGTNTADPLVCEDDKTSAAAGLTHYFLLMVGGLLVVVGNSVM